MMVLYNDVRKNTYYDSVTLMLFSGNLTAVAGVKDASVMMGTEHNKSIMIKAGILSEAAAADASPNDLIIGVLAENEELVQETLKRLEEQFENKVKTASGDERLLVKTLDSAVKQLGNPNFAVISLPGKYAKNEAMKAMKNGMHVLLFSDNVSLEEENELKDYATEQQLLMMGPDCGTAIINGAALGFANIVRRGDIGLVAAAGTGLQEATVLIHNLGGGISQALGTGGRDVRDEVGGKMMMQELRALNEDSMTNVIGIISKPPAPGVMKKVMELCKGFSKPVVACFLGGSEEMAKNAGAIYAETLQDAAALLVEISKREEQKLPLDQPVEDIIKNETAKYSGGQKHIRGLYSGGSLCYESILLVEKEAGRVYSNISHDAFELADVEKSRDNTFVDMGDDYFTDGMPHPMIDPRLRVERIKKEALDESVAIILLDCVLGYGSHEDPAGALAAAIKTANEEIKGRHITYIASICGTEEDFQIRSQQEAKLRAAGVIVMNSNAQAAKLAAKILKKLA
ncbi:MAG: acyl-CoA synthetase FdrA [Oscillospiraceae bacterium]